MTSIYFFLGIKSHLCYMANWKCNSVEYPRMLLRKVFYYECSKFRFIWKPYLIPTWHFSFQDLESRNLCCIIWLELSWTSLQAFNYQNSIEKNNLTLDIVITAFHIFVLRTTFQLEDQERKHWKVYQTQ